MAGQGLGGIAQQRLRSHGLSGAPFAGVAEVVGWLGAVQSQEYAVAKWSVGQRATGLSDADLDRALADGTILRTHVMRPTWHFVAAADVRWLLALTAPRVHAVNAHYYRRFELDEEVFARSNALLSAALAGGDQLIRAELATVLAGGGIQADALRLGYLLMYAELTAVICSGGLRGKQRTYALFDERVPPAPPRGRDEALADLTGRFFTSHGPATRADYQWWSGLAAADARRGLELAAPQLAELVVDGETFWYAAAPPPGRPDPSPTAHLLQAYDEYVIGYSRTRGALDLAGLGGKVGPDWALHGIILDGQFVGGWRRRLTARQLTVEARLLRPLDPVELAAVRDAADRYGGFLGVPTELTVDGAADA